MTDLFSVVVAVDHGLGRRSQQQRQKSHLHRRRSHLLRMKIQDGGEDVKTALLPARPLAGGPGVAPGVVHPSHGARHLDGGGAWHLDRGGAAAGRVL